MIKKIETYKIFLVAGLFLMGTAVFVESYKVASLSGYKSGVKRLQMEFDEKYKVKAPDRPVDESQYILAPDAPGGEASQIEKDAYENAIKVHEENVKALKEKYDGEMKSYNTVYKAYQRQLKEMELKKRHERDADRELTENHEKELQASQLSVNEFMLTTIIRFFGSIVLMIGTLGILLFGDGYERAGVLIIIAFGLKTIIGL